MRLIQQYLVEQGYSDIADQLSQRSGVQLEEEAVKIFKHDVLTGFFDNNNIPLVVKKLQRAGILRA